MTVTRFLIEEGDAENELRLTVYYPNGRKIDGCEFLMDHNQAEDLSRELLEFIDRELADEKASVTTNNRRNPVGYSEDEKDWVHCEYCEGRIRRKEHEEAPTLDPEIWGPESMDLVEALMKKKSEEAEK